jgi:hypothetical protein
MLRNQNLQQSHNITIGNKSKTTHLFTVLTNSNHFHNKSRKGLIQEMFAIIRFRNVLNPACFPKE